jgi:hypothetical protein
MQDLQDLFAGLTPSAVPAAYPPSPTGTGGSSREKQKVRRTCRLFFFFLPFVFQYWRYSDKELTQYNDTSY